MKHDLNFVDPLLLKLGPKVVEWPTMSKVESDLIGRVMELTGFEIIDRGRWRGITEADCRQVANDYVAIKSVFVSGLDEWVRTIRPGCGLTTWEKRRP